MARVSATCFRCRGVSHFSVLGRGTDKHLLDRVRGIFGSRCFLFRCPPGPLASAQWVVQAGPGRFHRFFSIAHVCHGRCCREDSSVEEPSKPSRSQGSGVCGLFFWRESKASAVLVVGFRQGLGGTRPPFISLEAEFCFDPLPTLWTSRVRVTSPRPLSFAPV